MICLSWQKLCDSNPIIPQIPTALGRDLGDFTALRAVVCWLVDGQPCYQTIERTAILPELAHIAPPPPRMCERSSHRCAMVRKYCLTT